MWCRPLRQVDKPSLDTKEGTLKVSSMLFLENAEAYTYWRKSEVSTPSFYINQLMLSRSESLARQRSIKGVRSETIYHIGAKYADLESLMTAFYATISDCQRFVTTDFDKSHDLLQHSKRHFDPASIIATLTFSIHPLPDGNGRTHRLVIPVHWKSSRSLILGSSSSPLLFDTITNELAPKITPSTRSQSH
jgi:Fic/DOC family